VSARNPEAYSNGYACGQYRRDIEGYDPRFDFADAAKNGKPYYAEFRRGFDDGFDGKEEAP
jgi:hypothetical protein